MTNATRRISILLLLANIFLMAATQQVAHDTPITDEDGISLEEPTAAETTTEQGPVPAEPAVVVDDYLESLSREELLQICLDRGFEVTDGDDVLEAARKCLSLEDEMNAILAEHPELAAELDNEITRLQQSKGRLESENNALLEQVRSLQLELEQAGVDTAEYKQLLDQYQKQEEQAFNQLNAANMTAQEVFKESMVQLYDRVRQDFMFVGKVLSPVIRSALVTLRLVWRYAEPVVGQAIQQIMVVSKLAWKQVEPLVGDKLKTLWSRAQPHVEPVIKKLVVEGKKVIEKIRSATVSDPIAVSQPAAKADSR